MASGEAEERAAEAEAEEGDFGTSLLVDKVELSLAASGVGCSSVSLDWSLPASLAFGNGGTSSSVCTEASCTGTGAAAAVAVTRIP